MAEQILPQGLRMFNKHANAPEFVIGTLVVTPDDLNAFCIDNPTLMTEYQGKRQLRLQVLRSKEGNLYCAVDTYKKTDIAPGPLQGAVTELPELDSKLPF